MQAVTDRIPDDNHASFHSMLLDAVGEAVIATDPQGGITYMNRAAERLYGWRADEALGRNILDVTVPPVSRAQVATIMAELAHGREWSGELVLQRRDGTTFPAEVHDMPILDQDSNLVGLIGVSSDISSRKKAEASLRELNQDLEDLVNKRTQEYLRARDVAEATNESLTLALHKLQESEVRYRTVVQNQSEIISRLTGDGMYVFVNEVFCRFFGKTEAELIGKAWHPLVYSADLERVAKELGVLSPSHPVVMIENRVHAGDGSVHWMEFSNRGIFDAAGKLIEIQSVGRDITERKRVEDAAREQFKLAETFFNHSVSCLVVLDRDFNFLRVNEAYARACRLDISAFAGRNHFDMYPSDTKDIFEEVVRTRMPFHTFERAFEFPDQPERGVTWWEWTLVPVLCEQGELEYLVFSLNEVTERKRAQEIVEQSSRQVQALSERVMKVQQEERGNIARELHDELGQTLTALKINLQMLEPYYVDGEAEAHLAEALTVTARALEQVRNMALDLHPLGLGELGLVATLQSRLAMLANTAGWDAHFEATMPTRLRPEVKIVCYRIVQEALTNIARHAQAKQVWVTLRQHADEVRLCVRDDGKGFDIAATSNASTPGSLGLIGMQERARQLAGQLTIHSVPGRGTEVCVSFPIGPPGGPNSKANASNQT